MFVLPVHLEKRHCSPFCNVRLVAASPWKRFAKRRLWLRGGAGGPPSFGRGNTDDNDDDDDDQNDKNRSNGPNEHKDDASDGLNWSLLQRRVRELRAAAAHEANASERNWQTGRCERLALLVFEDDDVAGFKYVNSEVLVGSRSGQVRWVDLEHRRLLRTLEAPCSRIDPSTVAATSALDFDGSVAAIGYADGSLQYWFLRQETPVNFLSWPNVFQAPVVGIALLPGRRFAAASLEGRLRVYPAEPPRPGELVVPVPPLVDIDVQVPVLSMEATTQHCLIGCLDGTIRVYSLANGSCVLRLNPSANEERAAGISAIYYETSTETLWIGDELGLVRALNLQQGELIQRFQAHRGGVRSIFADATKLVTAGRTSVPGEKPIDFVEDVLRVAETARKETIPIPAVGAEVDDAGASFPHIESNIPGLSGGSIRVWSQTYQRPLFELVGHSESLSTVQFDQNKMVSDGLGSVLLINRFGLKI
jgi:WD40 repeat protein